MEEVTIRFFIRMNLQTFAPSIPPGRQANGVKSYYPFLSLCIFDFTLN